MPWFGRSVDPRPSWSLPPLSLGQVATLVELARSAFATRGVETTYDGEGALLAMDGESLGLSNLAATVARARTRDWPRVVTEHVDALLAARAVPPATSLQEVADRVLLKLRNAADLPRPSDYAREAFPGLLELVAVDHPTHVQEFPLAERIPGGDVARAVAAGRANLAALPPPEVTRLAADPDGEHPGDVHVLASDDFFGASRALVLDDVLTGLGVAPPPHGVILAVPNRHLLVLHPLVGLSFVTATQQLLAIAQGECDGKPGAVSPYLYYRPGDGAPTQQITGLDGTGTNSVHVRGAFEAALARLGLVG